MYLVYFDGESSRRFDDPAEMGQAIAEYLSRKPRGNVRVIKYI